VNSEPPLKAKKSMSPIRGEGFNGSEKENARLQKHLLKIQEKIAKDFVPPQKSQSQEKLEQVINIYDVESRRVSLGSYSIEWNENELGTSFYGSLNRIGHAYDVKSEISSSPRSSTGTPKKSTVSRESIETKHFTISKDGVITYNNKS
jgi:hypothetical protein